MNQNTIGFGLGFGTGTMIAGIAFSVPEAQTLGSVILFVVAYVLYYHDLIDSNGNTEP